MKLQKIIEALRSEEETLVLELLDLKSDELVDAFLDRVEERLPYLEKYFG